MDTSERTVEVREFLTDIRAYLRSGLQSLEYQNTALGFEETQVKSQELLVRCESILQYFKSVMVVAENEDVCPLSPAESSYLDMSRKRTSLLSEYVQVMCPAQTNEDPETEIYDICSMVASPSSSPDAKPVVDDTDFLNCPYFGLPAAHLTLKKSPKQGLLHRIEKRLFFDQSKKYHCGIVADWLLCYTDATTSMKPTLCIPLLGVDIEHYGEGKRRDICFQISTSDSSRKFIFQSTSEVETKTWIHAIEAAIRGDKTPGNESPKFQKLLNINNNLRKLPTPPVQNKVYKQIADHPITAHEDIYEEPCPIYTSSDTTEISSHLQNLPPDIPKKSGKTQQQLATSKEDYDIPKTQSQPIEQCELETKCQSFPKTEFQTRIKSVQNKLSNQLLSSRSPENLKPPKKTSPQQEKKKNTEQSAIDDNTKLYTSQELVFDASQ